MCITEYNEKVFINGIREEGREEGLKEGLKEGQNMLVDAINRLRNGESPEQLLASGFDQKTVELAQTVK